MAASRLFTAAATSYLETTTVPAGINAENKTWSIGVWYKPATLQSGTVLGIGKSGGSGYIALGMLATGKAFVEPNSGTDSTSTASLTTGAWHHLGAKLTGTKLTVYLDGVAGSEIALGTNTGLTAVTVGGVVINGSRTSFQKGEVAHAAAWAGVALTTAQFKELFEGKNPYNLEREKLVLYYPLTTIESPQKSYKGEFGTALTVGAAAGTGTTEPVVEAPSEGGKAWKLELADTVTASDALVKGMGKTVAESITGSDAVAKATAKPLADSVAAVDALAKLPGKLLSDSVSASDALTKRPAKGLSESVTGAEALAKGAGKSLADSVTGADALSKRPAKPLVDSVTASDAISKQPRKVLAESVTASDSLGKRVTKTLADVVTAVDSLAKLPAKLLIDAVTGSDSILARLVEKIIPLAERPTTLTLGGPGSALWLSGAGRQLTLSSAAASLKLEAPEPTSVLTEDRTSGLALGGPTASLDLEDREAGVTLDG